MHRAIPFSPLIGVLASTSEFGGAYFALSVDGYSHGSSAEDIEFDTIEFQSGFSPALSGNVTTITVPSGATRLICSAWSGWGSQTELYFELRLKKNGSVVDGFYQATHEGYYSAGHISGIIDVSGGDTIVLEVNPGGSDTADFRFAGRFY